jgi:hypothetical protein
MVKYDVVIIIPVYNDWLSFRILLSDIQNVLPNKKVMILAVNDGGPPFDYDLKEHKIDVTVINLFRNLGHQKAIAIGLSYGVKHLQFYYNVVMDSDGEDRPADINLLLAKCQLQDNKVIFAKRKKRNEGFSFRLFYIIYKHLFRILTGTAISFGNFCLFDHKLASKIIYVSEIWNHFSGGIIKSKLPYDVVPLERGKRLRGESTMNFQSLMLHGLSAISVHIETVSIRILISSLSFLLLSVLAIAAVIGIRIFTDKAIPGWTSNMIIGFSLVFLLSLVLSLLLIFIILNNRNQRTFIPALEGQLFISSIETNYDSRR